MKDATGELSMTAVAVVAIAAIALLFSTIIWPTIRTNIMRSTYCSGAFNCSCDDNSDMCECFYCPQAEGDSAFSATCGDSAEPIDCPKNSN